VQSSSQIITTNKPTSSFFTGRMPFLSPNQRCQTLILQILISTLLFPSVFRHGWLSERKGIQSVKEETGCWFLDGNNLAGALQVLQLQLLPSPPSSCFNTIQNMDILVPAKQGPHGKWPERERHRYLFRHKY